MAVGMTLPLGANTGCPICLKSFDEVSEESVVAVACPKKHLYDLDCLSRWFRQTYVRDRKCLICFADAEPMVVVRKPALDLLQDACQYNNVSVLQEILQKRPELANRAVRDVYTGMTNSLFVVAVKSQSREAVFALIDHGLDVNRLVKYDYGEEVYPLHVAAAQGDVAMVAKLLGNGAVVDCLTQSGSETRATRIRISMPGQSCIHATPIGWAVQNGHCGVVKQLIDAGSTARLVDLEEIDDTLLSLAIDSNQPEVVRFLLLLGELRGQEWLGLDDESYAKSLLFPLCEAAIKDHTAVVEMLVGLCNTDSVRYRYFLYPLWYAVKFKRQEVVEVMLKAGFKNQINNYGQSLREYALQRRSKHIVRLIDSYDANYCVPFDGKILGTLSWLLFGDLSEDFAFNHGPPSRLEKIVSMLVWFLFGL